MNEIILFLIAVTYLAVLTVAGDVVSGMFDWFKMRISVDLALNEDQTTVVVLDRLMPTSAEAEWICLRKWQIEQICRACGVTRQKFELDNP